MMKKVFLLAIILVFSAGVFAQNAKPFDLSEYGVKIEPDKRLIVVLASLEVADMDIPLTNEGIIFRRKLDADTANMDANLRRQMQSFVARYQSRHPNRTKQQLLAPFISMAYALSPVPELEEPARSTDLPDDLLEVLDYAPLVQQFYQNHLSKNLDEYVQIYRDEADQLRPSAVSMVRELLDYMNTRPQLVYAERVKTETDKSKSKKTKIQTTSVREKARRFFIVPELLAPKNTVNFINIGDDYFAVVSPETDLTNSEVRRAYLRFVLDPLVLNNATEIFKSSDGIKSLLAERRKINPNILPDIYFAVLRSLVAAVDARQIEHQKVQILTAQKRKEIDAAKGREAKLAVSAKLDELKKSLADQTALELSQAYENGAVLAFYFAKQLEGIEDSGFDIESSMRDMILSLDTTKETNRLAEFADAKKRAVAARSKSSVSNELAIENPVTKRLLEIDKIIIGKKYAEAKRELTALAKENPNDPRVYYSLGRLASLTAETATDEDTRNQYLLEAKNAYEKTLTSATAKTDAALISLSYVALGRIYEFVGQAEYALQIYNAAVKVGDVEDGAFKEAQAAVSRLTKQK